MKKSDILKIFILFIVFILILCFTLKRDKMAYYQVLKVIGQDELYIDLNNNNKIDDNELFKLKNIKIFTNEKNPNTIQDSSRLGVSPQEYLEIGYLAKNYLKDKLEGHKVLLSKKFEKDKNQMHQTDIYFENNNLTKTLLRNGLAHVNDDFSNVKLMAFENYRQMKINSKGLSKLNFVILNKRTNIYHKLNSEHFDKIYNGIVLLKSDLDLKNTKACKICFEEEDETKKNENKHDFLSKIYDIPKSKEIYLKSINKKFDEIELYLINPLELKKPDYSCKTNICRRIVNEINSSKTTIDLAMFEINGQKEIVSALKNAKNRGVKINAVLDKSKSREIVQDEEFLKEFNVKFDTLKSSMHNKFIIFDDKKLLVGSMNLTPTGSGGYNSNNVFIFENPKIASIFKNEFSQMFLGKFSSKKQKIEKTAVNLLNSKVEIYFCPKDDVLNERILPLIKEAKTSVYVSAFYLTHKDLIFELINAKKRGVRVLIIQDALAAINFKDRVNLLRNAKIPVIVENWGGKNHSKTILIDSNVLITGSANFSKNAYVKNDESVLIIKNSALVRFYEDYFLSLFNSIDFKYLKQIPRSESFESINSCFDGVDNNFDGKTDLDDDGCKLK